MVDQKLDIWTTGEAGERPGAYLFVIRPMLYGVPDSDG